jgi:sugar phosphate isomerase/epimerase
MTIAYKKNKNMQQRRDFLKTIGLATAGMAMLPNVNFAEAFAVPTLPAPGIQLFTLFSEMDKDTVGSLQKVAAAGYKNIESAFSSQGGFYGKKPKEFAQLIKDLGMEWRAHHVMGGPIRMPANYKLPNGPDGKPVKIPQAKNLTNDSQELIDAVAEAGIPYIVCANIPDHSGYEIKEAAEILHRAGEQAKKAGVQLVYHNHNTEFASTDGIVAYDYFLSQVSADHLKMELDLGWAFKAGKNPVEIFKKNPGRFPLWHVKDMDKEGNIVPFGEGAFDFKSTFQNAKVAGLQYFFIEQDFPKKPFENIVTCINNYKKFQATL